MQINLLVLLHFLEREHLLEGEWRNLDFILIFLGGSNYISVSTSCHANFTITRAGQGNFNYIRRSQLLAVKVATDGDQQKAFRPRRKKAKEKEKTEKEKKGRSVHPTLAHQRPAHLGNILFTHESSKLLFLFFQ